MFKTLIVVDNEADVIIDPALNVVTFDTYLAEYPKLNEPKTRLINLCDTGQYLSRGYYCSLLAEARQHRILPSVSTINDLRELSGEANTAMTFPHGQIMPALPQDGSALSVLVYFGWTEDESLRRLARQLFEKYPAPLLQLEIRREEGTPRLTLRRYAYTQLTDAERARFLERLTSFTERAWRTGSARRRTTRWDMAILVDPEESYPPSNREAVSRFVKAAGKVGIHAELLTAAQATHIGQFDALFIRETTAIDHHTYRLARRAEQEGLVVIDDPTSILRCCNKVFLHDAFSYNKVPAPRTEVVTSCSDEAIDTIESQFDYPIVLKMPEGSFSKGVFKVKDRQELQSRLAESFKESALMLAQEFLYTDFDWRIGVLNGRAIYACRYLMARNHWQIYNHDASRRNASGGFETLPTFEVPKQVLDAALRASNMIGKGLYGVEIKQKDNHVYVIEVNDNPSIDHGVEDHYLGNELYMLIMQEFASRLEKRGR